MLADLFGQKTVVLRPAAHCISFSNQFHCCKISFGYSTQFIWETFSHIFSVMSIKEIIHRLKWHYIHMYILTYIRIRKDLGLMWNCEMPSKICSSLHLSFFRRSFSWCPPDQKSNFNMRFCLDWRHCGGRTFSGAWNVAFAKVIYWAFWISIVFEEAFLLCLMVTPVFAIWDLGAFIYAVC